MLQQSVHIVHIKSSFGKIRSVDLVFFGVARVIPVAKTEVILSVSSLSARNLTNCRSLFKNVFTAVLNSEFVIKLKILYHLTYVANPLENTPRYIPIISRVVIVNI